jgi:hemoglobin-like flavoprotein
MSALPQTHTPIVTTRVRNRRTDTPVEAPLTAEQKELIRDSFRRIEPALELVAQLYCLKLFRLDPTLRRRFAGPIETQTRKFMAAAKLTIISLDHDETLKPTLKLLGVRHRQIGIRARHYRTMTRALIWTLEQSLERRFDSDTKDAWAALCGNLTCAMNGA